MSRVHQLGKEVWWWTTPPSKCPILLKLGISKMFESLQMSSWHVMQDSVSWMALGGSRLRNRIAAQTWIWCNAMHCNRYALLCIDFLDLFFVPKHYTFLSVLVSYVVIAFCSFEFPVCNLLSSVKQATMVKEMRIVRDLKLMELMPLCTPSKSKISKEVFLAYVFLTMLTYQIEVWLYVWETH